MWKGRNDNVKLSDTATRLEFFRALNQGSSKEERVDTRQYYYRFKNKEFHSREELSPNIVFDLVPRTFLSLNTLSQSLTLAK